MPPELTFDKLTFRVYRGPILSSEGSAARVAFRRDTSDVAAVGVDARFPPSVGRPATRLTAATLVGNLRARTFEATGGVHAEQAGEVADTEQARYDGADGVVRGDRPVTLRGPGFTASGAAFTLDPREQTVRLEGGADVVSKGGRR